MKLVLSVFCFMCFTSFSIFAQQKEWKSSATRIGFTFSSFGENDVIRFHQLTGDASYSSDKFYTLGITFLYKLNSLFDLETGVEYSRQWIIIKPNLQPQSAIPPYGEKFSLLNFPVTVRMNFLRYFFLNGGLLVDMDVKNSSSIDKQSGMGGIVGLGIKYDISRALTIFANPYLKAHTLVPFSSDNYNQRLMETGFRFGLMVN